MNIHDPWTQLHIFSTSQSEGKSATFMCLNLQSLVSQTELILPFFEPVLVLSCL